MNMEINPLGLIAALTAFVSIWAGHVSVRKIEAETIQLWKPMLVAIAFGIGLEIVALTITNRSLSTVFGILGITLLWDALELRRQAKRVCKGHAPANPRNPRHAALLAEPNTHATPLDILDRNPVGRTVSAEEAILLVESKT